MNRFEYLRNSKNHLTAKLARIALDKETNICVSCDLTKANDILALAKNVGPHICMIKTHVDIVEDFSDDFVKELINLSRTYNFLIFEDRKFADIGNTVRMQYEKGIYNIASWADIVNAHTVPGPGIIEGLIDSMKEQGDERGLIMLAQMTPEGTLAHGDYTQKSVAMCEMYKEHVMGFIASSQPKEIKKLRELSDNDYVFFSPGVKLKEGRDEMGQQYSTPEDVIGAGSDMLIVGRGVYQAENPLQEVRKYQKAGWDAVLARA